MPDLTEWNRRPCAKDDVCRRIYACKFAGCEKASKFRTRAYIRAVKKYGNIRRLAIRV